MSQEYRGRQRESRWDRSSYGPYNYGDWRYGSNSNNYMDSSYSNVPTETTRYENYQYMGYENSQTVAKYYGYENRTNYSNNRQCDPKYYDEASNPNCPYNMEYRNWEYSSLCSRCRRTLDDLDDNIVVPVVEKDRDICKKCSRQIGNFHFRDTTGWLCEQCCAPRRACNNTEKGCTHADLDIKMFKHEMYFCWFLDKCNICMKSVPIGTIFEHYKVYHASETVHEGAIFRVKNKGPFEYAPHIEFFILAEFGPAVCTFFLKDGLFRIGIHTPIHFSELHKYKCVFEISEPYWKTKTTYVIRETYLELRDWYLVAHKNDFAKEVPWTEKADVAIRITKIDE